MDILDLSCGIGYGTALLAEGTGAGRVVGVDCSESAIAFAREFWSRPNVEYVRSSAGRFPLEADSFDLIVSYETVEHLANDDAFVTGLWRSLKPGGILLLSAPNQNGYAIRGHRFHVQHYSADGLMDLLRDRTGIAELMVLGQVGETRIEGRAGGKHLITVARRASANEEPDALARRLSGLLPFTDSTPPCMVSTPIRIRAHRFLSGGGRLEGGRIVSDAEVENTHVASGPYYRLATGRYVAGFLLRVDGEVEPGTQAGLVLDVADGEGRLLSRLRLTEAHLRALARSRMHVRLPFRHDRADAVLQFRVYVEGRPILGRLEFFGVELRAAAMRDDLLPVDSGAEGDPFLDALEVMDLVQVERERFDALRAELESLRQDHERFREHFQHSMNDWTNLYRETDRRLRVTEEERDYLSWESTDIARDRDDLRSQVQALVRERDELARACDGLRAERDAGLGQLAELQGRLRPYVIVDRIGVVPRSLGLAQRLKRRLGASGSGRP
jgi:hypothetical protein